MKDLISFGTLTKSVIETLSAHIRSPEFRRVGPRLASGTGAALRGDIARRRFLGSFLASKKNRKRDAGQASTHSHWPRTRNLSENLSSFFTFLLLLCGFAFIQNSHAQSRHAELGLMVDVIFLASDHLEGRETGKNGEALAAEYIAKRFEEIGLQPKGTETWFQPFSFTYIPDADQPDQEEIRRGKNVIAFLDKGAEYTVMIGAHYDHLGHGHFGSRAPNDHTIHNGADDNASGVAAMLYLAEQLQLMQKHSHNYLFIAFSGEEMGLRGSKYYVAEPVQPLAQVNYMINLDMVGRLNDEKSLTVNGTGSSPAWKEALMATAGDLQLKLNSSGTGGSDHTSFYLKGIPALHFFTGQNTDYHKPSDDSHLINYGGLKEVSEMVLRLISHLDPHQKLTYAKTKEQSQGRHAARYKVSMGVMPDYSYDKGGMRIDAVLDDRPAQRAGLEDGDIIIRLGTHEVDNIYDYMDALSACEKGKAIKVKVKRGDKILSKKIVF